MRTRLLTATSFVAVGVAGFVLSSLVFGLFLFISMFAGPGPNGLLHLALALLPALFFAALTFVGLKQGKQFGAKPAVYGFITAFFLTAAFFIVPRIFPSPFLRIADFLAKLIDGTK